MEERRRRLVVSSVAIERRSASLRSENHRQAKQRTGLKTGRRKETAE
jgi:hypothetical protein